MTISNDLETKLLNLVFNATAYAGQSTVYAKMHTGDPGENCTSFPATETTRKAVSMGVGASGTITNDAIITWTAVIATETITHISLWDNLTAGNPLWYGPLTISIALTAGGDLNIIVGDLVITLD